MATWYLVLYRQENWGVFNQSSQKILLCVVGVWNEGYLAHIHEKMSNGITCIEHPLIKKELFTQQTLIYYSMYIVIKSI